MEPSAPHLLIGRRNLSAPCLLTGRRSFSAPRPLNGRWNLLLHISKYLCISEITFPNPVYIPSITHPNLYSPCLATSHSIQRQMEPSAPHLLIGRRNLSAPRLLTGRRNLSAPRLLTGRWSSLLYTSKYADPTSAA